MQVEQVHLVDQFMAIEGAIFHEAYMEPVGVPVNAARSHAAARAFAANDQALDAQEVQVRDQRRALEDAGALLTDHHVSFLRREIRPDLVVVRVVLGEARLLATRGSDALRECEGALIRRTIDDRDARLACRSNQPLGRLDRVVGVYSAGTGIALEQRDGGNRSTAIGKIIEVDQDQCRPWADKGLTLIWGIELNQVLRHDVCPGMIFKGSNGHDWLLRTGGGKGPARRRDFDAYSAAMR